MLEELTTVYPPLSFIRSDNELEFIAQALWDWCEASDTLSTAYTKPASPWENGFAASFNGCFRDGFLNTLLFTTPSEAQLLADHWRQEYNTQELRSTLSTGRIWPSSCVHPWRQCNQELQHDHDHPLSSELDR